MQIGGIGGPHTTLRSTSSEVLLGIASSALAAIGEFHIVLEDCHVLKRAQMAEVCAWVSLIRGAPRLLLWLVSTPPIEVPGCWRYKFMTKPDPATVHQWIVACDPQTSLRTTAEVGAAANAAKVFLTREPMVSSVLSKDLRSLVKCVFALRDSLITRADKKEPNILQFSAAWASLEEVAHSSNNGLGGAVCLPHVGGSSGDPASPTGMIQSLGVSAQLLTLAAFFCGTVTPSFDKEVFSRSSHGAGGGSRKRYSSLKDTVISSSNFSFAPHRLYGIYASMVTVLDDETSRRLCLEPTLAMHFQGALCQLGVLVPHAGTLLKCHLSPLDATALGKACDIDIMSLIPMKQ